MSMNYDVIKDSMAKHRLISVTTALFPAGIGATNAFFARKRSDSRICLLCERV